MTNGARPRGLIVDITDTHFVIVPRPRGTSDSANIVGGMTERTLVIVEIKVKLRSTTLLFTAYRVAIFTDHKT